MKFPVPTVLGIKSVLFYAVLTGAFFAAPYQNLYFLLLVFLTVLGACCPIWTARNLAGATARFEEPEPVPAGTSRPLQVGIDAGRRLRFGLSIEFLLSGNRRILLPGGVARGATTLFGRLPALPRGVYLVERATLFSTWPLGLMKARRDLKAGFDLIVYPAPTKLPEARGGAGGLAEICGALGVPGGDLQPSTLREYREGDELRQVHWKASARRRTLVIKEWEGGMGDGLEVVLDRRAEGEALEESLSLIAALALAAKEEKEILTVHSQGLSRTFGREHGPWRELLRFLAGTHALPAGAAGPPPVSPGILRLPGALAPTGGTA